MRRSKLEGSSALKVAVIDMGTNTFHLIIASIREGKYELILKEKQAVKIGEKGINEGFITQEAHERAIRTMINFRNVIDAHEVKHVQATATSALRNAKNGAEVTKSIFEKARIAPKIITGLEEANLIYNGVKEAIEIGNDPALIMDIGGGSIEFIIGNDDKVFWKQSFEIGGQRLLEKFHKNDPISLEEHKNLKIYLKSSLSELIEKSNEFNPRVLIGSSGTFDTLSDIYLQSNEETEHENFTERPLSLEGFRKIHKNLISKNREERLQIPGMIEMRVDMIVVASILVSFVLDTLKMDNIRVSSYALKEGLLLQMIQSHLEDQ